MPRSPSPRRRCRRRMMAVHHLDRPGRDQHGDRRRARACQPPAGAAAARRRLRQPRGPIRCCSRSRISATARSSANDCFRPVSRYFDRITRPEQIIAGAAARHAGADRSGRVRAGDAGALPGRAGRGLRLSGELLRRARLAPAPRRARTRASSRPPRRAPDGAKKPLIIAGGGVLYSEATEALAAFAETHGIPVAETQAGKSSAAARSSAQHGRDRRHRHVGGQRAGRGGRRGARRRHAAAGFHHRLVGAVQEPGSAGSSALNVQPFDAGKHRALPLVADATRRARGARRPRSAAGSAPSAWLRRAPKRQGRMAEGGRAASPRRPTPRCRPTRR